MKIKRFFPFKEPKSFESNSLLFTLTHIRRFSQAQPNKSRQYLLEIAEDSPYRFLNHAPPKEFPTFKLLDPKTEVFSSFKQVYLQFLNQMASGSKEEDSSILK
jgi:hypothetical protein